MTAPDDFPARWEGLDPAERRRVREDLRSGVVPRTRTEAELLLGWIARWRAQRRRRVAGGLAVTVAVGVAVAGAPLLAVGLPPPGSPAFATYRAFVLLPAVAGMCLVAGGLVLGTRLTERRCRELEPAARRLLEGRPGSGGHGRRSKGRPRGR